MMNNPEFRKTIVRKQGDIMFATKRGRNNLVLGPNYHTTMFFTEDILAIEMKKKTYEYTGSFRTFDTRVKQNIKV